MAGIYIHIPFCKQACHYCDFHFSTNMQLNNDMIDAMIEELYLQKSFFYPDRVDTIYFGGGTPSLLSAEAISRLLSAINNHFKVSQDCEITLEANPDDLSMPQLAALFQSGINRLSIGIQSFYDAHLQYLNRAHHAKEAIKSVENAYEAGFKNLSIDLIYAIPAADHTIWQNDLQQALQLRPQHISSYCLTIEEKTAFGHWLKKGKLTPVDEAFAARQFEILLETLGENGYEQYEISNFSLPGYYSRHNSNYWKQAPYLGIGPSAHSYNGKDRQHNVANNVKYLKAIRTGKIPFVLDELSKTDRINEYLMTTLRTKWGVDLKRFAETFGYDLYESHQQYWRTLMAQGLIHLSDDVLTLTDKGKLLADQITEDLFIV